MIKTICTDTYSRFQCTSYRSVNSKQNVLHPSNGLAELDLDHDELQLLPADDVPEGSLLTCVIVQRPRRAPYDAMMKDKTRHDVLSAQAGESEMTSSPFTDVRLLCLRLIQSIRVFHITIGLGKGP